MRVDEFSEFSDDLATEADEPLKDKRVIFHHLRDAGAYNERIPPPKMD